MNKRLRKKRVKVLPAARHARRNERLIARVAKELGSGTRYCVVASFHPRAARGQIDVMTRGSWLATFAPNQLLKESEVRAVLQETFENERRDPRPDLPDPSLLSPDCEANSLGARLIFTTDHPKS